MRLGLIHILNTWSWIHRLLWIVWIISCQNFLPPKKYFL
nr:MAG TPA: hypothetical protein [Caudoviricetes sp.]